MALAATMKASIAENDRKADLREELQYQAKDAICVALIAAYFVIEIFSGKIDLYPFNYNQEVAVLLFGSLPESIGQHPLFYEDSFIPLLHYLPLWLVTDEYFTVFSVFSMAMAPWILLYLTLRVLSVPSVAALIAVIGPFYIGSHYGLAYLQEPNPFMVFRSVNFRMIIFPLMGLFVYLCATRRWLLAGLAMGLIAASHAKFGAKLWLLTSFIFVALSVWRSPVDEKPTWKSFFLLQLGFVATFAYTAWQLSHASGYFARLPDPRVDEMISPFGYLLKNEPDDFLFLFNSPRQVYGAFVFIFAGGLLSTWLLVYGKLPVLRRLAKIGLIANIASLSALTVEVLFEKVGMSLLPPIVMLKIFMLRPWDFLWVAPLSIGVLGSLALALQPRRAIGGWAAAGLVLVCIAGVVRNLAVEAAPWSLLDRAEQTPSAVPNYVALRVCSSSESAHRAAKAEAIDALWNRDRVGLDRALDRMNRAFNAANNGEFSSLASDPEADNLRAMFAFRVGDYAKGYADLLMQNKLILNPAPGVYGWMGDTVWECAGDSLPDSLSFYGVVSPWKDFDDATKWINRNTPALSRVIHLPSLAPVMARTKRVSFWETKIDSHPMYSFPGYYGIGLDRLQAIAGPNSIELAPGFRYGDPGEIGRRAFLKLTAADFKQLSEKYGLYEFIMTERQHQLDLPLVYANDSFAIYRQNAGSD